MLQQMALLIIQEIMSAIYWEMIEIQFLCKEFVRKLLSFLVLYRVFKSMEPLYFDSPTETGNQKIPQNCRGLFVHFGQD